MHAQELISEADFILSEYHYNSLLTWRDAVEMYETAGNLGSGEALAKLAYMYWGNSGKPYFSEDYRKVFDLYRRSVALGYRESLPALIFLCERVDNDLFVEIWKFVFDHSESVELAPSHVALYLQRCIDDGLENQLDPRILSYKTEIFKYHNTFIEFYLENLESLKGFYKVGDLAQLVEESLDGRGDFTDLQIETLIRYRSLRDQLHRDLQAAEKAQKIIAALEAQKAYKIDMNF